MSDLSSDSSSESETNSNHELDLNTVNECIREYEKGQKKERKKRWDAGISTEKVVIDPEIIQEKLVLTRGQITKLEKEQQRVRTQKQREAIKANREALIAKKIEEKKILDLRKDKTKTGVEIEVKPIKPRPRKPKVVKEESESEEEEPEPPKKTRGFQAKKPQLDDEDDIEHTVAKLNKINSVLESGNPYLAMIMKNRMGRK